MDNSADKFVNDFLVVEPTVKEILDLVLGENSKESADRIEFYSQRLFPNNQRAQALAAILLKDMHDGTTILTSAERLELLELFFSQESN